MLRQPFHESAAHPSRFIHMSAQEQNISLQQQANASNVDLGDSQIVAGRRELVPHPSHPPKPSAIFRFLDSTWGLIVATIAIACLCAYLSPEWMLVQSLRRDLTPQRDIEVVLQQRIEILENLLSTSPAAEQMHNFASEADGAVIAPDFTTSGLHSIVSYVFGGLPSFISKRLVAHSPSHVLDEDMQHSNCWNLTKSKAQVGIALSAPVHVTHITLDYPSENPSHKEIGLARSVAVWGVVEGERNLASAAVSEAAHTRQTSQWFFY
ncbi:hypothetical protein EUX98_g1096 [Antrodiella citrinella]|uniref:SUN domain-containing protein n=1 Tax=Antrodiella citrinella TaxID=2447956 RepID=A0A4S4N2B4_9APHY|nr:hypothetical protein EUX98_g1096 [Antrodiella citrinella]